MNDIITARDIEMVTSDIRYAQRQGARQLLSNLIEIGRLLVEAKSMVPRGEWGKYLEEKVDYSQSTANNLMKLYQEYGDNQESFFGSLQNSQAFGNLTYTQALALLALPAEERREFAEKNDVADMSTRQLEQAIRERNEAVQARDDNLREYQRLQEENQRITAGMVEAADKLEAKDALVEQLRQQADKALADAKAAAQKIEDLQGKLGKARENEKNAKAALKQAKEKPEIPESVMEILRSEVEAEAAKKATEELQKQLEVLTKEKAAAETVAADTKAKLEAAQKQLALASPDAAVFKAHFTQVQEDFKKLADALAAVKQADPDTACKLTGAVRKLLEKLMGDLEG